MQKLRKTQINNGVFWVGIEEAGVYILCGCPADSVKHLMKQGLIVTRREKGVTFETGPNVVLLSDVLVQNGSFSNLAEFPILQMLYRQGMLLPNHVNNTGLKPMIIGAKDQVEAQMQYIMRGNYGLLTKEEMIEAGASPKMAEDMMRLKLKFAFGKIRRTIELLDTRIVRNRPVEIRNGVFVSHLSLNVFKFEYKGEKVIVDLNLGPNENYNVPYSLGFHHVKREYFAVIHSGDGDGWDIYRPCMSSILTFQGKIYLIDIGPNILNTLLALGISVNEVEGIFHTHCHDDHFAGLTTLMQSDHRIKYYTTPLIRKSVAKKLSALVAMDESSFNDFFEVCDLEFDVWNNLEGLEVKPILSPHPVETNIFIFRTLWADGYKSYAHFADIVALDILKGMVVNDENELGVSIDYYNKVKDNYLTPENLKKLDIGGGLIHGKAEDFRNDVSDKIILAHTSVELTHEQKEIGSGAPFGMVDTLIPSNQTYVFRYAAQFLRAYFPYIPMYNFRILLNNEIVIFNPESIILKGGVVNKDIYLVLTGNVEQIHSESGLHNVLSAGALVGELSGLTGSLSLETYRAVSFVHALRLPEHLYLDFVKRNGLYSNIKRLQENRRLLQGTWLFGEGISYPKQNKLAQAMSFHKFEKGSDLAGKGLSGITVVKSGKLQILIDGDVFETLSVNHFFGEEGVLFGMDSLFRVVTTEPSEVYNIPTEQLIEMPVVRWRLFETFKKRRRFLSNPESSNAPIFSWRDEFRVNISDMDKHHRLLFEKANKLHDVIGSGGENDALMEALNFLVDYTQYHFKEEEEMMRANNYPEYESQRKEHEKFVKDVLKLKEQINGNDINDYIKVLEFFKEWIINHILTADRKYGPFLNIKGIF